MLRAIFKNRAGGKRSQNRFFAEFGSKLRRRALPLLIIAGMLIVAMTVFIVMSAVTSSLASSRNDQRAAERWSGDGTRYAQISCFMSDDGGFDALSTESFMQTATELYTSSSIEAPDGARLIVTAASCAAREVYATTGTRSATAEAIPVTGDFFLFHPLPLAAGNYFLPGDIASDRVVIDEQLAWLLFGSSDVVGMSFEAQGVSLTVAGVAARESGSDFDRAYGDGAHMWLPAALLGEEVGSITCFEALMPDPVTGFALSFFKQSIPVSEENCIIVENSSRFRTFPLFNTALVLAEEGKRTLPVVYPYWENIAHVLTYRCAVLILWRTVMLSLSALCVISAIVITACCLPPMHRKGRKGKYDI